LANQLLSLLKSNARYLQNLSATFISQGITALSLFVLTRRLLEHLGQDRFNEYWIILNLIVVAAVLDLGQSVGLSHRLIQRKRNYSLLISTVFFLQVFIFLLTIPVLYVVFETKLVSIQGDSSLYAVLAAVILFQNIVALLFDGVLQSFNKIYISKWLRAARTFLEMILVLLIVSKASVSYLLLSTIVVNVGYLFFLYYYSRRQTRFTISLQCFNKKVLCGHLNYSKSYLLTILAGLIAFNVQILLLQSLLAPYYMAVFLLVFRFFEVIRLGLTNFTLVLFPSISSLQASGSWCQLEKMFFKVIKRITGFAFVVLLFVYLFGDSLFTYWSGYGGHEVSTLFYFSVIYTLFIVIDHVSVVFQYSLNIQAVPAIVSIFQSLVSLLLTVYFVHSMGMKGAILASLISFLLISFIFNPLYLLKRIRANQHSLQIEQTNAPLA
jgi:O-antigen/teichoic acid export membrane protein